MNVKKWKNNKFIENLKIKQYPAYPAEFIVFLCVTLFRQKMAEKRYTICILLYDPVLSHKQILQIAIADYGAVSTSNVCVDLLLNSNEVMITPLAPVHPSNYLELKEKNTIAIKVELITLILHQY